MEASEADSRSALVAAVDSDVAEAHLVLVWRERQGNYRAKRVQMDEGLAAHFRDLARQNAHSLLSERHAVEYDPEWQLKAHEYFAISQDPPPGGNLFKLL